MKAEIYGLLLAAMLLALTWNQSWNAGSAYSGTSLERRVFTSLVAAAAAVFSIIVRLLTKSDLEPKNYTLKGVQHA